MTKALVATKIRVAKALEAREAGQGTLEYVGMIVAVAVVLAAVIAIIKNYDMASKVSDAFDSVFA